MLKQKISVLGLEIVIERIDSEDYISFPDRHCEANTKAAC
jgi:hypothetical protein